MENLAKVSKERDAARAERAAREAEARALETRLEQESKRLEGLRAEVADMTDKYTARLAELQAEHRAAVAGSEQLVKDKDALAERRAPSRTRPASGRCGGGAEPVAGGMTGHRWPTDLAPRARRAPRTSA